jgi:hypothetical protein
MLGSSPHGLCQVRLSSSNHLVNARLKIPDQIRSWPSIVWASHSRRLTANFSAAPFNSVSSDSGFRRVPSLPLF